MDYDKIIAEKIMGWERTYDSFFMVNKEEYDVRKCEPSQGSTHFKFWSPSTDIRDTLDVINKVPHIEIIKYPDGHFFAGTGGLDPEDFWKFSAEAPTFSLAVCRVILQMVEG